MSSPSSTDSPQVSPMSADSSRRIAWRSALCRPLLRMFTAVACRRSPGSSPPRRPNCRKPSLSSVCTSRWALALGISSFSARAVGVSGSLAAATASMISSTRVMEEPFSRGVLRMDRSPVTSMNKKSAPQGGTVEMTRAVEKIAPLPRCPLTPALSPARRGSGSTGYSFHRRHGELGAGADASGPAPGHGLHPGEEAHAIRAVHVQRAEDRALPAAEAVEGHGHRDRHVDADHADVDTLLELPRGIAVAGEDRGTVAVFVVVDQLQRLLERSDPHHGQHRPEDFLLIDAHLRRDVIEQRRADVEAVLVAFDLDAA